MLRCVPAIWFIRHLHVGGVPYRSLFAVTLILLKAWVCSLLYLLHQILLYFSSRKLFHVHVFYFEVLDSHTSHRFCSKRTRSHMANSLIPVTFHYTYFDKTILVVKSVDDCRVIQFIHKLPANLLSQEHDPQNPSELYNTICEAVQEDVAKLEKISMAVCVVCGEAGESAVFCTDARGRCESPNWVDTSVFSVCGDWCERMIIQARQIRLHWPNHRDHGAPAGSPYTS